MRHCVVMGSPFTKRQNFDRTKFKAFADDKLNVAKMMIPLFNRVENTVGKGENAGYQHFLLFPQSFCIAFFFRVVKGHDHVVKK